MMKKHFYKKEFIVPIYKVNATYILSNDYEKVNKYTFDTKDHVYASTYCFIKDNKFRVVIVLNFDSEKGVISNGVIAHEALHFADMIFDRVGVDPDDVNDEAKAYLIEYIVDTMYKFINQKGFKVQTIKNIK